MGYSNSIRWLCGCLSTSATGATRVGCSQRAASVFMADRYDPEPKRDACGRLWLRLDQWKTMSGSIWDDKPVTGGVGQRPAHRRTGKNITCARRRPGHGSARRRRLCSENFIKL